jgi:predicted XRE-type DNA-binding protein
MTAESDGLEFIRGSGNAFRDLGRPTSDLAQLKCVLAAGIIEILDARKLSVEAAEAETGIDAADYARIRKADLVAFSVEPLIMILNRLDQRVDVSVRIGICDDKKA